MRKAKLITYYLFTCFRTAPVFSGKNYMYILLPFLCSLLFALCSLFPAICSAQQSITWQRVYDGCNIDDLGYDVCLATNGNFYVLGSSQCPTYSWQIHVLKLNPYGDTIWTKTIGNSQLQNGYAITPSGDGGCVLSGYWDSSFTIKLDSGGNIVWQRFYGGRYIKISDIMKTYDGGYIACGAEIDLPINGFVLKIDSSGNLQWQRFYPSSYIKGFNALVSAIDSGYILVGNIHESQGGLALVMKIDNLGNIIWERHHIILGRSGDGVSINRLNQGYLIGGGTTDSLYIKPQTYMMRLDLYGNEIFTKVFETSETEYFWDVKIINNNKYVFALGRDTLIGTALNGKAIITDSNGAVLYEKIFPLKDLADFAWLNSIQLAGNGDIIFAGTWGSPYGTRDDFYVIRTDSILNVPPIGIKQNKYIIPDNFKLYQNYPNPFNPSTEIKFDIPVTILVNMKVFDLLGREVITLVDQNLKAGSYLVDWNSSGFASGIYICRLSLNNKFHSSIKMVLLR